MRVLFVVLVAVALAGCNKGGGDPGPTEVWIAWKVLYCDVKPWGNQTDDDAQLAAHFNAYLDSSGLVVLDSAFLRDPNVDPNDNACGRPEGRVVAILVPVGQRASWPSADWHESDDPHILGG